MEKYKQFLSWVAASVTAIIIATIAVDSRYAHSDEIDKYKSDMKMFLISQQHALEKSITTNRIQMLDDQIFALRLKSEHKKLDTTDNAMLNRYISQRELLIRETQADYQPSITKSIEIGQTSLPKQFDNTINVQ